MTYEQASSVAVQCMARVEERLHILDLYAEPTGADKDECLAGIREATKSFQAAWSAFLDADRQAGQ